MNARLQAPTVAVPYQPHDAETERLALGAMMLGYPSPAWLRESDFFAAQHARVFITVLVVGSSLPLVAARMREDGWLYIGGAGIDRHSFPNKLSSVDLVEMCDEAEHALSMGWAIDWPRLRELAKRRELLQAMRRVEIAFEEGGLFDMKDARAELARVFQEAK